MPLRPFNPGKGIIQNVPFLDSRVSLKNYSAACALADVPKPRRDPQTNHWRLYYTPECWAAVVSVGMAFELFHVSYELVHVDPPNKSGYLILPDYVFKEDL
jgi:hypothetical protein